MMTTNNNQKSENTFQKSTWLITPKTNLHVGNECSTGYGLIDKSVQRDALMKLPCINSSSLKGALNEFCCHNAKLGNTLISPIFGSDKIGTKSEEGKITKMPAKKGNTLFFDAHILFLPVQDDVALYKLAYCDEVLDQFIAKAELFGQPIGDKEVFKEAFLNQIKTMTTKELVCKTKSEFIALCDDDELPIIARNVLENGESQNLWYEQVVPSETIFYTFLQSPTDVLEEAINSKIVQIGANATIGYGYCQFTKI